MTSNQFVRSEYQEKSCDLDEYWDTMQRPSSVSPEPQGCRNKSFLPSYAASSPLVVQILSNKESVWIDLAHSMKEWIDFAYALNVCLRHLVSNNR